jgi:hypothetical protein
MSILFQFFTESVATSSAQAGPTEKSETSMAAAIIFIDIVLIRERMRDRKILHAEGTFVGLFADLMLGYCSVSPRNAVRSLAIRKIAMRQMFSEEPEDC